MTRMVAFWLLAVSALLALEKRTQNVDFLPPLSCGDPVPLQLAHPCSWHACPCDEASCIRRYSIGCLAWLRSFAYRTSTSGCQSLPGNFWMGILSHANMACKTHMRAAITPQGYLADTAGRQSGPLELSIAAGRPVGLSDTVGRPQGGRPPSAFCPGVITARSHASDDQSDTHLENLARIHAGLHSFWTTVTRKASS